MLKIETLIENISSNCMDDLPGKSAQDEMLAKPRAKVSFGKSEEHAIPSAVLILLLPKNNNVHFVLTKRTNQVQHHKGQISLPGGTWESGEQLHETALRETEEEIGVLAKNIKIVVELTPLFVKATGYMIHPFVGYICKTPVLKPCQNEVKAVFTVSVTDLLNPKNRQIQQWQIRNTPVDVPFFKLGDYNVWGATAMILSEFSHCMKHLK